VRDVITVPLRGKKGRGLVAVVDRADAYLVKSKRWYVVASKAKPADILYAYTIERINPGERPARVRSIKMHHMILGVSGERVDHWDGDGLNNRRGNLRQATDSQNKQNQRKKAGCSSRYKGVTRISKTGRFVAGIKIDGVRTYLGTFGTAEEAARVYDAAARERFGSFAALNFPELGERSALTGEVLMHSPGWLRTIRQRLGLDQAGMAARLGVPRGTLGCWEAGKRRMTAETIARIEEMMTA